MAFETREKDLLARIGRIKTKTSTIETPLLLPVINPVIQPITPKKMKEEFDFQALITNAYILRMRSQEQPTELGLHKYLDFDGTIMTDSGAYQILVYGDIQSNPKEIVEYQEQIDTDIATILDIPTGWKVTEDHARQTVKETLNRAKQLFTQKTRDDILWVGPVQGGRYLDLVAQSARETAKLPFQIHALGSPTEVMERYRFDVLVDMIMTAKMNLPIDRPLHLFGAGHPFMFALAVALGCDLFDSAAYALYARENRYMTEDGTHRLNELDYFPCQCPKCTHTTPEQAMELPQKERAIFLAEHNLYVCAAELRRIKQAIKDGRLWEHLELRAHAHPALLQALKKLGTYTEFIERHDPITKNSGQFYFNSLALMRPEVYRHRKNLKDRFSKPKEAKTLLLIPQTQTKPFHKSPEFKKIAKLLNQKPRKTKNKIHVCFYVAPFGVIPIELDEVYPLSQHEIALPLDKETIEYVSEQVANYINYENYTEVVLFNAETWHDNILKASKKICQRKNIMFKYVNAKKNQNKTTLAKLEAILRETP